MDLDDKYRIAWSTFIGLVYLVGFALVTRRARSSVNAITPLFCFAVLRDIIVEIGYVTNAGGSGELSSFITVSSANAVGIVGIMFGYLKFPGDRGLAFIPSSGVIPRYGREWILLLLIAFLLFLPVLREFSVTLANARTVYTQTRTGYGVNFFLAIAALKAAFVFLLFRTKPVQIWKIFLLALPFLILASFSGSKGSAGGILIIAFLYAVTVLKPKYGMLFFLFLLVAATSLLTYALVAFSASDEYTQSQSTSYEKLLSYTDYNRNAQILLESNRPLSYGKIMAEDFIISKIPRVVWPNKPKDFGSFALAADYFPTWFLEDSGAPSFGVGAYFADFGFLAYIIIGATAFFQGYVLRALEQGEQRQATPYGNILLQVAAGFPILAVGVGSFTIEILIISIVLAKLKGLKIYYFFTGPVSSKVEIE